MSEASDNIIPFPVADQCSCALQPKRRHDMTDPILWDRSFTVLWVAGFRVSVIAELYKLPKARVRETAAELELDQRRRRPTWRHDLDLARQVLRIADEG